MDIKENKLITIREAADFLGVKPITLRKWDREGKLKSVRVGMRGDRKYYESDLKLFLKKSQKEKVEWSEYIRSGASLHHVTQGHNSFDGIEKHFGCKFEYQMSFFEGDDLYWYYNLKDVQRVGRIIVDKLTESQKFQNKFFKDWDKKSNEVLNLIKNNNTKKIKSFSDNQLASLYRKFDKLFSEYYGFTISIDATDEAMMVDVMKKVKNVLKKKLGKKYSEKEFSEVYNNLTMPGAMSYVAEERRMVLELARDIKSGKFGYKNNVFLKKVDELIEKFWWTSLGWARGAKKTREDVIEMIQEVIDGNVGVDKELLIMDRYEKDVLRKKKDVENKYNFSKNKTLVKWLKLLDRLIEYHDFRKEVQMKVNYWTYLFFEEIAKRKGVPVSLLDWCEVNEIIDLLEKNKFNETEINQRSKNYLYLRLKNNIRTYTGKEAVREYQEMIKSDKETVTDIQGICASGGNAVGKAHVAITVETALKIKKGDILITGMTTPEFVPAMRKAIAIVTDEGGITCHAAIVSRELGIPCIVGTKQSTRLIKTGDLLEVKANHGTVKIIKN